MKFSESHVEDAALEWLSTSAMPCSTELTSLRTDRRPSASVIAK